MKTNKEIITLIKGIIIFNIHTQEEEIIPRNFEYPKHYREYCRRDEDIIHYGVQDIIENNGDINQKDIERQMNYQPIIFTNENNDKLYAHLIELNSDYSMILFSYKLWRVSQFHQQFEASECLLLVPSVCE